MKDKGILVLIFLFTLILTFNLNVSAASNLTDIDNIYNSDLGNGNQVEENFKFKSSSNGKDMQFQGLASADNDDFWNKIFESYSTVIVFGSGLAMVTFLGIFILNITKLNISSGNPEARKKCIINLLWTGVAAALLGGVTLISGFSSGLFKI